VTVRERALLRDRIARARLAEEERARDLDPLARTPSDPAMKLEPEDRLLAAIGQKQREESAA